jgi:aspartyl-tRNA(Asn)/glutamyl-tRNA(Gln) amidotransferase subunit A
MKELIGKSISKLQELLASKQVKAKEVCDAHLNHIDRLDKEIFAFNTVTHGLARKQAELVDQQIAAGDKLGKLAGIPIALKDNICLQGYPTTCSSKILANFMPPYDATVTKRLFEQGAVCVGKTNMDEFAMGSSTENSAFKPTLNPWSLMGNGNKKLVPGGSSGGSTASVAAGFSTVALGSDTGGSIRQPASFCGVVGMKPTYGLVSRFGLVAFASSLDQIGPLGRTTEDVAITLSAIAGHDSHDSTSLPEPKVDFLSDLKKPIKGLRLGIISELLGEGIEAEIQEAIKKAIETYRSLGAKCDQVSMPNLKHALPVYYIIATAEASANLARYDGVRYGLRDKESKDVLSMYYKTRQAGFGAEVKRRIMLGTFALSTGYYDAYYKKAQQVRQLIKNEFDQAFQKFDLLICPTSPSVAFEFGAKTSDPLSMYLSDIATIPANLAGIPAVSLPCSFDKQGLPIGLQLMGPALSDAKLLQAAFAFESTTNFDNQPPPALLTKV